MRIGYYVRGHADEAVVWGLAGRWCPDAALAPGRFRGSSKESFRRELRKSLMDLAGQQACDVVVVLTDADVNAWRDVQTRETAKIPDEYGHLILFGVADRNTSTPEPVAGPLRTGAGFRTSWRPDGSEVRGAGGPGGAVPPG